MRERVEDLGRIAVMIEVLLDDDHLDDQGIRPKDFVDHFRGLSEEDQDNALRCWAYSLQGIRHGLSDIREIALGQDTLNDPLGH